MVKVSSELIPDTSLDGRANSREQIGQILLAGHFDPAMVVRLLSADAASQLAGLTGPPGVPIHHLASGLASRGMAVTVLGGLRGGPKIHVHDHPVSATIYSTRSTRAFTLTGFRRERRAILERLREIGPAMVHAHWTMEAARAVADWDGPKILTVHDAAYEYARLGWRWHPGAMAFKVRWLVNTLAVLRKFDHVIAVSPYVETYLRLRHRYQGEIRVIPNAIPPLSAAIRTTKAFPRTGRLTFGCYGGPGRLKNIETAIRSFLKVQKDLPGSQLLIFGEGWSASSERYRCEAIKLRGSVKHDVFVRALVSEVDIWVHPARIEAHPITICEAIQAGCPVIAGKASGGVSWTLDYGRAGLLIDTERTEDVADAMIALAIEPRESQRIVAYGRQMIQDRFSPDQYSGPAFAVLS